MNQKGFIRTLEAVIAVIIVLGIILALAPEKKQPGSITPVNVREAQSYVLDHIIANEKYRTCILHSTTEGECQAVCAGNTDVSSFIQKNMPSGYQYRCEICNSASTCSGPLPLDKSLYTDSRLVAADPAPHVIRIIMWEQ